MSVSQHTENLFLKPFIAAAQEHGAILTIEALSNPIFKGGTARGKWCFGVEVCRGETKKRFKLVTSSTGQTLEIKTPNGIFSKIGQLGFTVVKIPWQAGQQAVYAPQERNTPLTGKEQGQGA